jgi:hypothetical protein
VSAGVLCAGLVLAGRHPGGRCREGGLAVLRPQRAVGKVTCAGVAPGSTAMIEAALQRPVRRLLVSPRPTCGTPARCRRRSAVGQTVAVVTAYDDPIAETDIATYRTECGIPACSTG